MVWKRLPTYLVNMTMRMMPLTREQLKQVNETGWLREVVFRTTPNVNKVEVKEFFETVYNMPVESVNTINYRGKKKQALLYKGRIIKLEEAGTVKNKKEIRARYYRTPDWKKLYVRFVPPPDFTPEKYPARYHRQERFREEEDEQKFLQRLKTQGSRLRIS